jgi:hypothetical protein
MRYLMCWLAAAATPMCLLAVFIFFISGCKSDEPPPPPPPREQEALPLLDATRRGPTITCLFLVVGELDERIAQAEGVKNLKYARADHERLAKAISGLGVPEENLFALRNEQATLARVEQLLTSVAEKVKADDTVIFMFIGHGVNNLEGQSELLLYDGRLPVKSALEQMGRVPASKLVVVLDACRAGNPGRPRFALNTGGVRSNGGLAVLSSSRADQVSYEADSLKQGVFSYHLAEILENAERHDRDNDGWLSLDEIGAPLKQKVMDWMETQAKAQEPFYHRIAWDGTARSLPVPKRWGISVSSPGTLQTKVKVWFPPSQVDKDGQKIMLLVKPAADSQYWPQPLTVIQVSDKPGCVKTVNLGKPDGTGIGEDFRILLVVVNADQDRRFSMGGGFVSPYLQNLDIRAEQTVRRLK